jgi:hypothetical protein
MLTQKIQTVQVQSYAVQACKVYGARVSATVRDVQKHGPDVSIRSTAAKLTFDSAVLTKMVTQYLPSGEREPAF